MTIDTARRPPRRWEIHTWVLLGLAGASTLIGLLILVTYMGLYRALSTEGRSGMSILVSATLRHAQRVDDGYFILLIAYLVAFSWWLARSRRLLAGAGHHNGIALTHWALVAWKVGLVLSFLVRLVALGLGKVPNLPYGQDPGMDRATILATVEAYAAGLAVRLVAQLFLVYGVWQIRAQIRRAVASPVVRPPRDPAAAPAFGPPPVARDAELAGAGPAGAAMGPIPGGRPGRVAGGHASAVGRPADRLTRPTARPGGGGGWPGRQGPGWWGRDRWSGVPLISWRRGAPG